MFLRRLTVVLGDINLNRLVVVVAVVEAESLTSGASRLGLAKAMVSAHMQRQEAKLGASLAYHHRASRRLYRRQSSLHVGGPLCLSVGPSYLGG